MLINNVSRTIDTMKGVTIMTDREKFRGFKQAMINDNEEKYGKEIREKYGDSLVDSSNAKIKGMSEEEYTKAEKLRAEIDEALKTAMVTGDPSGEHAQKACELHKQWICMFWKDGSYSKETHKGLGEMYVADERFKAYYDKVADGAAEFLRDALNVYCGK